MSAKELEVIIVLLVLIAGGIASVITRKLTVPAGITAIIIGVLVYAGAGLTGLAMLFAFFIMATLATAHKKSKKAAIEKDTVHQERRTAGQVLANGGIPAILGLFAFITPGYHAGLSFMFAGALSAATADTLSSELGMVYGRTSFNILTLKKEPRGRDGVVSIAGFIAGAAGSLIIGTIFAFGRHSISSVAIIVLAGTIGNIADSVLGATLERRNFLNNNMVNTLNTLAGAIACLLAMILFY